MGETPKIATTVVGDGPARLVFLHGLMGRGKNFTSVAKSLSQTCTSLLVDLPNHGSSEWTSEFSYADTADAIAEFLGQDFAQSDPIYLLGHSLGGKVAMLVALRHPDLVKGLIVVDVAPTFRQFNQSGASAGAEDSGPGEFVHLLSSLAELDLAALESRTAANAKLQESIASDTTRGFLLQNLRSGAQGYEWQPNLSLLLKALPQIADFPVPQDPPTEYAGPVLWLRGERSDYVQPSDHDLMRTLFPRMVLTTIKDAGHWVHSDMPAEFVDVVSLFITTTQAED